LLPECQKLNGTHNGSMQTISTAGTDAKDKHAVALQLLLLTSRGSAVRTRELSQSFIEI